MMLGVDVRGLLREARSQAGLSQSELAARAHTSQPAVARYESGRATPSLATLGRLLAACGRELVIESGSATATPRAAPRRRARRAAALHAARERLLSAA